MTKIELGDFLALKRLTANGYTQEEAAKLWKIGTTTMYYIAHSDTYEDYQRQMKAKRLDNPREELKVALEELQRTMELFLVDANQQLLDIYKKYSN